MNKVSYVAFKNYKIETKNAIKISINVRYCSVVSDILSEIINDTINLFIRRIKAIEKRLIAADRKYNITKDTARLFQAVCVHFKLTAGYKSHLRDRLSRSMNKPCDIIVPR